MTLAREAGPLLEAACVAPDEEAPRRRLATWLSERGHPLGAFMTLQLDRHREEARTARPHPRFSSEETLGRGAAERAWVELVPELARLRAGGRRFQLVRGMPEALAVGWDDLADAGWLARLPLAHLDVIGPAPDDGIDRLLALGRAHPLTSLALAGVGLDDRAAEQVAAAPWPRLRWLDLSRNRIGEQGAEALVASRGFEVLALAELSYNEANPTEGALDAYTLGEAGPERHGDEVIETVFSPWAEAIWRRHGQPPWTRVLWRRASERPHRWNVWSALPERDLRRNDLEGAVVLRGHIERVHGQGGRWVTSNLAASTIDECDFADADLADTSFARAAIRRTSFARARARRLDFRDAHLTDCDLAGTDLREAWFERATIIDCRLRGARLGCDDGRRDHGRTRAARFMRCDLRDVDLEGRELLGAELVDCKLAGLRGTPQGAEHAIVRRADLSATADGSRVIEEASLSEVLERRR